MAITIEHPDADELAQELAQMTGESITDAVLTAIRERLAREAEQRRVARVMEGIRKIQAEVAQLPVLDPRTPDEILGYDENGLPT